MNYIENLDNFWGNLMQLDTIMISPVNVFTPHNYQNKPIYGFVYIS
jgi:hypothetical protein